MLRLQPFAVYLLVPTSLKEYGIHHGYHPAPCIFQQPAPQKESTSCKYPARWPFTILNSQFTILNSLQVLIIEKISRPLRGEFKKNSQIAK
jgi:hypothetical protein